MPSHPRIGQKSLWTILIGTTVGLLPMAANGGSSAAPSPTIVASYHSVVPLGEELLPVAQRKLALHIKVVAESAGFDGWQQEKQGERSSLRHRDGGAIERYPEFVDFRVAASLLRVRNIQAPAVSPVAWKHTPSECVEGLRFRVKIFRGLEMTVLEPERVRVLEPGAESAPGRALYLVSLKLPAVPLEDRIVLEVLTRDGERLMKFHLPFI